MSLDANAHGCLLCAENKSIRPSVTDAGQHSLHDAVAVGQKYELMLRTGITITATTRAWSWCPGIAGITITITITITASIVATIEQSVMKFRKQDPRRSCFFSFSAWPFPSRRGANGGGAVEHGVAGRHPLGVSSQVRAIGVDAPRLQFALGTFLLAHRFEIEIGFLGNHDDLRERLVRPKNMCLPLRRRLEDAKEQHWPPVPDQRRYRDGHGIAAVGIETRVWFGTNSHAFLDLEIEQYLIGVEGVAKISEGRPLGTAVGRFAPNQPPGSDGRLWY